MIGSSPKPEVLYLPAIFRAIKSGHVRIPAFQRGFVWKQSQILDLLESVYNSYPIGSLLFWNVNASMMRTATSEEVPFPHPPIDGPVDFVLDGMQRISSLYGAFNARSLPPEQDLFAVYFDLEKQQFVPYQDQNESSVSLRDLFHPRPLLEAQARVGALANGDVLVERSLELQRRFQEYLIPIVRIGSTDSTEVVRIFERVNSTGTLLSAVDFMRALTWSNEFDLTNVLLDLSRSVEEVGIAVPPNTIAKCLALEAGVMPISGEMVKLRGKSTTELSQAVEATRSALMRAAMYLREGVGIRSYDYVPYEGQFLVFVSTAAATKNDRVPEWLVKWYWTVGFSEALQGRPDHYIARLAQQARQGEFNDGIHERLSLTREALITRPMRKGASLPVTFVASLATDELFSVQSGEPITTQGLLSSYDTASIAPVFGLDALRSVVSRSTRTNKIVANSVILAPEERGWWYSEGEIGQAILRLASQVDGISRLHSQCIDADCLYALERGEAPAFVEARAAAILNRARDLSGQP